MRQKTILRLIGVILPFLAGYCGFTQTVNICPGVAPGSEHWKQTEQSVEASYGTVIINVVTPTITPNLPEKSRATGTGVIVAPGGSCVALAIQYEGVDVAKWLRERGIAAEI